MDERSSLATEGPPDDAQGDPELPGSPERMLGPSEAKLQGAPEILRFLMEVLKAPDGTGALSAL